MTPLEIEILLHYYARVADYRNGDHSAPAVKEALTKFLEAELIRHEGGNPEYFPNGSLKARYALMPRGMAYVGALLRVQMPVAAWLLPAQERTIIDEGM